MTTTTTSLICNKFAGIRKKDARFSNDFISCSDCQNVELFYTGVNSGIGIRTAKGNVELIDLENETIINIFESIQGGSSYCFLHTENTTEGSIYLYSSSANTVTLMYSGLSLTGKSCGVTVQQGWTDQFIFSNSEEILNIQIGRTDNGEPDEVHLLELTDVEGNDVKGLGLQVFDGRLFIFGGNTLWYSRQEGYSDFSTFDSEHVTSAGYIKYIKEITAIHNYLDSLAVFHSDSSSLLKLENDGSYSRTDSSPGGCASYNSLIFHGTSLYFYDNTKKGVFSFEQVVNGDKTLGQNVAEDIQDILYNIPLAKLDKIRTMSVVTDEKNEIWFLVPDNDEDYSTILIFDYLRGEWLKRKSNKVNCFLVLQTRILSGYTKLFEEYNGYKYDGEFINSYYNCSTLNLGSDNTLKVLYFPPRVTLDMSKSTNFYVKYIRNYDFLKKPKEKLVKTKIIKNALYWDIGHWDINFWASADSKAIYKFPGANFKALEIKIYTKEDGQEFSIMAIEMSKIKVKQV